MGIRWEDLEGHVQNIRNLRQLLDEDRVPHALLFCGPEGVGKYSVAEVFAAALLCQADAGRPCGQCASCQAMLHRQHPDFYTISPESKGKAAKTIKIEQIRELQAEIARVPYLSARRVVLMDAVETMKDAAANSLLKTLEEPVGQAVFILVTSAPAFLLPTILSRCMPVRFGSLSFAELQAILQKKEIPEASAKILAPLADGSAGRALTLYEQGGLELRQDVLVLLRTGGRLTMETIWQRSDEMGKFSKEKLADWFMELTMLLRDLLVLYSSGTLVERLYHQDLLTELSALLPVFSQQKLFSWLQEVKIAQQRLTSNMNQRLLAEGFLIRLRKEENKA